MKVPQSLIVSHSRLLLCFMCCTTVLSMWLSNTSTTAMVMPIVEAVLQELVNAEEEHDVISTTGNTIIEENESIGICQYWSFFFLIYQWPESLIYTIQILSRSELFDLYCQIYWSILFLFAWSYFFQKWKTVLPWNVAEAQTHALWLSHACPFYSCPSKLPSSEQVPEKISSGLVRALGVSDVPRKKEFGKKKISHFFQFIDSRLNNDII